MQINDIVALLMQISPVLASGWAAWFLVGLVLSIWGRREQLHVVMHPESEWQQPEPAVMEERPERPVRRPAKNVPHSSGDAFGELAALLEPQEGTHRMPGDASPVLREETQEAPVLAGPRSLP
jgi:hypothetical protein